MALEYNQREERFRVLLKELGSSITTQDVASILDLLDHNELGIAFENFCTQLYEHDATCSPDQLSRIAAIGTAMGISSDYWTILKST